MIPPVTQKSKGKKSSSENKSIPSSLVKRHFGHYFSQAIRGEPVLIRNALLDKNAVLIDADLFEDLMEIIDEVNDEELNRQLEKSHEDYEKGRTKKGIEGLIDIMNETTKKD